jgi:hypothetical protein
MNSRAFTVFLLILLFFTACEESSDEDQTFTSEEYLDIGMPDYKEIWSLQDYNNTCAILDNLKTFKPLSLPRKDSKRSGVYFKRIINPENLSFLVDESIPLKERALQIQQYVDIQGLLISIYTDIKNTEQYYKRELIDLYIFGLTIGQNMLDLGQRINESIDEEDINMQYAYRSIQNTYITMVLFVLGNQKKANLFEESDLERLTDFISSSIQLNKDWMEEAAVENLIMEIKDVTQNTSSKYIIEKYNTLLESL